MTEPIVEAHASGLSQLHEQTVRIAKVEALVNTGVVPLAAEEIAEGPGAARRPVCGHVEVRRGVHLFPGRGPGVHGSGVRAHRSKPDRPAVAAGGSRLRKAGPS
ncbi:hypothetical protein ACN24L_00325 [Streptomyces microflavus]